MDYFPQFYEPKLKALGYGLIFKKKTNAFFEGIMLGYKLDRLQQEAVETIEYDQLKPVAGNFKRGNVAIIAELRLVEEKQRVLVANTHLFYEPAAHDIRFAQISYLLSKVEQLEREKATDATFICGDLNAAPGSPAISRAYGQDPVLTNETPEVVRNVEHFAAEYPHKLKLKSAYEDYQYRINKTQTHETGGLDGKLKGHPEYTCYGNDGPEMLDYIFCSEAY